MTWLKWAGPKRLAVSLTALLIAAPTHVLAEAPVPDSQTIAAKIIETNGAPPARFRETLETVNEHGEHTIRTVYRDGSDARSVSDSGPFHEENGTLHGQAWRQNANGQTILRQPDPGDERHVLPTTTVTRITEPVVGYVVARLDEHGEGTKDYVDASTWRIVRQDGVTANGTSATTYDDFRSDGGRVFTHHWRTVNGINHTTTDTTVTAYVPGGVTAADLAIPPPARALVEFPPGVTSVTLPTHFSDRPFNGERINVRLTIAGRGLDFVLDTGASGILMDSTVARQLGLHLYQQQSAVTAARYESAEAVVPEIHVGDLVMHNVAVHVAPLGFDNGNVKEVGLLGFDFLAELGVTIDYDQKRVTVVPGDAFVPPTAPNAIAVPVRVGDGEQEVTLTFNGAVGERWGLDTGVRGTFMVFGHFATRYPDAVRQDRVVPRYARYGVGSGVGGSFDAERLHVRSVVLGNVTFTDVIGTLVTQSGAYDAPMDGVIGAAFLHFFTVELDDTHSTVYFIPNEAGKRAGLK
ncbi:MAG: retropepsin-like aspartic protease [Vulcanimicrobiaceae bacterium]|jgi:predicted aspartyl protease